MDAVRIGKVENNGRELIVLELFGIPLACASGARLIEDFDRDPVEFADFWGEHFRRELVSMIAEDMQKNRRVIGWALATRLAPRFPGLPEEGEGS